MKERGITDGLTMNQLAERNAEYVMTIVELEEKCAALSARLSMINDLMEAAEQANKLAQEATETLVQERNALAAENAALKGMHHYSGLSPKHSKDAMMDMKRPFIDELIYSAEYYSVCGHISASLNRAISAVHGDYSWLPETPATDAFMAEVRAQGVERYAEQLKSEAELADETGWDGAAKFLISESGKVLAFAAQIRQEAAQ